jgi:hypothetical protein
MLEYRKIQYSLSIKSFTDFSGGYERFKIKRYSPGTDFGIRARGEERKVGKGGVKKGPEIRPKRNVFVSFSLTAFPFCKTLFELEHEVGIVGQAFSSLKPNVKPSINSCLVLKSWGQFLIIIVFKGE